jgi:hypothetical protein
MERKEVRIEEDSYTVYRRKVVHAQCVEYDEKECDSKENSQE